MTITVNGQEYPVTPENVSLSSQDIFGDPLAPQPPGYVVEGDTITWHFTDLEPDAEDNIYLNALEPQRYERLVEARRKVEQAGSSAPVKEAAAYLELGRAARGAVLIIKDVSRNGGGKALGEEASRAYERTLELDPEQRSVYSEYARWLLSTGGWRELEFEGKCPPRVCELVARGLEKFPQDAELQELDTLFKDTVRMRQTENAYATEGALATEGTLATSTQGALETRAYVQAGQDFYLCPLGLVQLPADVLAGYLARVSTGAQPLITVGRPGADGVPEMIAEGFEVTQPLTAQIDDQEVAWTERRLVVRSVSLVEAARRGLQARLSKAQTALAALVERKQGKRIEIKGGGHANRTAGT